MTRSSASVSAATSFTADIHENINDGIRVTQESGTIAFQAPSSMDFKLSVLGHEIEVLALLPDEYMRIDDKGWYNLGEAVINRDAYAAYVKNRGPVDYAGILSTLKHSEQLPDATIDDIAYQHYTGTFNIRDELNKIPKDVFKQNVPDLTQLFDQDGAVEAWIDASTGLPRRFIMTMTMKVRGSTISSRVLMDYTSWNQPLQIPSAPTNAKPYSDLTGG